MHFATSAVLLAGLAAAQSNVVQITSIPDGGFTVNEEGTIKWATTDTTAPVEIVLKEPDASNPQVYNPTPIATVVDMANPALSSVQYKPTACGQSLALEIIQDQQTNYVGPFNIGGACSSTASSYSSSTSASSSPSSYSASTTVSASSYSASSSASSYSSIVPYNATTSYSSATSYSAPTTSASVASVVPTTYSVSVSNTTIAPYQNSTLATTASTPAATTSAIVTAPASGAVGLSSPLALIFGVVAALAYLA